MTVDNANTKQRVYYKPDEDFYRSITIDELHKRVKEDVHQWYKERDEYHSVIESTAVF
jgi:hypothetical protein